MCADFEPEARLYIKARRYRQQFDHYMKITRRHLLVAAAALLLGANAGAQDYNCSGAVTDAAGHPLAGATVEYWSLQGMQMLGNQMELKRQTTTGTNGAYQLQVSRATGLLLAKMPGLAPAWKMTGMPYISIPDTEENFVLAAPMALAGVVVDEADKPVANAEVSVVMAVRNFSSEEGVQSLNYIVSKPAHDCFSARTDASGHFRIGNFPTNVMASLTVQAPGKALRQSNQTSMRLNSLPWQAGQEDIKLVVEPAGNIEGKIIVEGGNQPPPIAQLTLQANGLGALLLGEREPALSGADGSFRISDVPAGAYRIQAVFGSNAVAEWVADTVPVSVESGQTARGVEATAMRGGALEVAVLGQNDRKPMAEITVYAYKQSFQAIANSDSNGLAQLSLPPGDYQVMAMRQSMSVSQAAASVEAGKTNRIEMEIAAPKKITGIVRQPDGRPAAGLPAQLVGGFNAASGLGRITTDAAGKFEMKWDQRQVPQGNFTTCILARDPEHNLAAAQDIDEDSGPLELKLEPGLTLAVQVESDGKPVTNATIALIFYAGNRGMHLAGLSRAASTPGRFEIPAMPPGRKYGIAVSARGYGQKMNYDVGASAEAGRMELDPVELKPANLKLAGQVLDSDDKPVAGAFVNLNGDGQPMESVTTDRDGRFLLEHACEGSAQLSANNSGSFGNISVEGGDTNVVLRLGQSFNTSEVIKPHKLTGTVSDADGKPAAGAQVAVFPSFDQPAWKKTATNGAFSLTWSLEPFGMQSGGAKLVVRDPARNLAATAELDEETTNLDVKLKPALTVAGQVRNADDSPLAGAQIGVWLKAGNSYDTLNEQQTAADAQGRYEIKCLPPEAQYIVFATAKGHGRAQQQVQGDPDTNCLELPPFLLKLADQVLAGQVVNTDDKPVSGVNVQLNGNDQPEGMMATDSKGRFHFQVCEGRVTLFASSQSAFGQATAESGDTNVVITLGGQMGGIRQTPSHASLKGKPLPDLAVVSIDSSAAPANRPLLLCLFDAGQRASRHAVQQLGEQAAALRQQGVTVLGIQAAVTTDEALNEWKSASPVSFPLGRVTEKSGKTWASAVPALPWLILTDAAHRVIAEGFPLDELDAQIKQLPK
jgi:protocatechuate 3,4-dioxygenase beta subunit